MAGSSRASRRFGRRDRALQVGFVVVAVAIAGRVLAVQPAGIGRGFHALLLIGGRVIAGWSVGLAFRMQQGAAALSRLGRELPNAGTMRIWTPARYVRSLTSLVSLPRGF